MRRPRNVAAPLLLAVGCCLLGACANGAFGGGASSFSGMNLRSSGSEITAGQNQSAAPASAQAGTPAVIDPGL